MPSKIIEIEIMKIASEAALGVPGVSSMDKALRDGIPIIRRKIRGVSVSAGKDGIIIELYINVVYGSRIPHIAWEVQQAVKYAVTDSLNVEIKAVNVHVQGVEPERKMTDD